MGRGAAAFWLVGLLVFSLLPIQHQGPMEQMDLEDDVGVARSGASNLSIVFSNGPAENDVIKGTKALSFTITGTGTLDSLLIELSSDETSWSTVVNLTSSPWIYPFDTTKETNDTYKLRASGWDSDTSSFAISTTDWFDIANQVPVITSFTVLNAHVGSGTSLTDRA